MVKPTLYRKIIVLGPQASGKGTQAAILAKDLDVPWISTGEIFRRNIQKQTELGKLADQYVKKGKLVPDEVTNRLVNDRLKQKDAQKGFVFDGYPRNKAQAEALDKISRIDVALEIWISDKEAIFRISGRRVCKCGMIYHIKFNPPRKEGVCDNCKGKLFQREDDKKEAIMQRLSIYHKNTEPLLKMYLERRILVKINGEQPISDVTAEIYQKLNSGKFTKE